MTADPVAGQLGPTATLNLIYAFNDLRSSQDALTSIWINYYATRASLAQQLGVMDLTDDGLWVDKPFMLADRATEEQMPLPPQVPQEWLDHLEDVDAPPPLPAGAALPEPGAPARLPDVRARALRAAEKDAPSAEGTGAPAEAEDARSWTLRLPGFGGKGD